MKTMLKRFKKILIPTIAAVTLFGFSLGSVKANELKDLVKGEYYTITNSSAEILRIKGGNTVSFQGNGDIALFKNKMEAARFIASKNLEASAMSYGKEDYEVEMDIYEKGSYSFKHLVGLFANLDNIKVELEKQQMYQKRKTDKVYADGYDKISTMPDYEVRKKNLDAFKVKMDAEWNGMVISQNAQLNFYYLLKSKFTESDKLIVTDTAVFLYSNSGEVKFRNTGFNKFNAKSFFRRFVGNQTDIAEVVMWIYFQSEKNFKD